MPSSQPATSPNASELSWQPDVLGPEFSQHTINLGIDPDGEGSIVATLVRYNPSAQVDDPRQRPAILWVHGMTDYFFQTHVAEAFAQAGYAFYALDLRKCGRSHRPGQRWHYISDLRYYYAELNYCLDYLARTHGKVIPCAHSTGGLVISLWLDHIRRTQPRKLQMIPGALFNSPWWHPQTAGIKPIITRLAQPVLSFLGRVSPNRAFQQNSSGTYGRSLHQSAEGRWEYSTTWKPFGGHTRYYGWLRAIIKAQGYITKHGIDIGVPALALFAADSNTNPNASDVVLDVEAQISQVPRLGRKLTVVQIAEAIHDISLSAPAVARKAFAITLDWLNPLVHHTRGQH